MPDATLITFSTPEATVVKISGELRLRCEEIEHQLDRVMLSHPQLVVLDLGELAFMSSLGMGIVITLNRNIQRHGGQVRLAGVQPNLEGALRFTRLTDLIKAYPTVEAAIAG
jgi:anti-anti-sigma factor